MSLETLAETQHTTYNNYNNDYDNDYDNNNNNNVPLFIIDKPQRVQSHQHPPHRAALTQLTIYRGLSRPKRSHTRREAIDNRTGSAS